MTISVRSPLLAGTAAMVTATALTVSGMTATGRDLPSVGAASLDSVTLTALANPLLAIYDTIQKTNFYLFSTAEPPVTSFDRAGIVPDLLAAGFPIVTQYFLNAPDYVNQSINYLFQDFLPPAPSASTYPGALRLLTWAVDALPANIGYAAQQLFAGNLVGALQTVKFAVINPIQAALYQTLNAGLYAVGGVGVRAAAVITAIAEWVPTTIRNLADDVTVVANAAFNVVGGVAYGIQTLNPEFVWNSLVQGLLGTSPVASFPTIPDALINQTIGEGGRIYTVPGQPGFLEVPSMRQNLTELRDNIADALATDVPLPADPPFPVNGPGFGASQIPTPWQQTPVGPPVAAARSAAARSAAAVAAVPQPAEAPSARAKGATRSAAHSARATTQAAGARSLTR